MVIYDRLNRVLGYDTFLDVETINGGRFATIIQREIINRDVFVVILTPDTLESEWVVREVQTALDHRKSIVPLIAQGFSFATPLPDAIKDLSSYDAVRWDHDFADAAFERLIKAIDPTHQQTALPKPKTGMSTEVKVAIIGGIFVVIAAAIGILPTFGLPAPTNTQAASLSMTDTSSPTEIPNPSDTPVPPTMPPSPQPTQTTAPVLTGATVKVTNAGINLRSGPSADYPAVYTAARNEQFPVIARNGYGDNTWYLVTVNSELNAWIFYNLVYFEGDLAHVVTVTFPPTAAPQPTQTAAPLFVIDQRVVVLNNPSLNTPLDVHIQPRGAVISSLMSGTPLTIIGGSQDDAEFRWWQVRTPDGTEGWVAEVTNNYQNIIPLTAAQLSGTATARALPTTAATPTSQPSSTPPPTTPPIVVTLTKDFLCTATISGTAGALLNQVHVRPQANSPFAAPVQQASTVSIREVPTVDGGKTWYHIHYNADKNQGWITSDYIKSSSCPA